VSLFSDGEYRQRELPEMSRGICPRESSLPQSLNHASLTVICRKIIKAPFYRVGGNLDIALPRAIDKTLLKMHELATLEETGIAMRTAFRHLDRLVLQKISRPAPETIGSGNLSGIWNACDITPFLKLCHELVLKELEGIVTLYPSFQWIWYLRRLPLHVFSGNLRTTFLYDITLAETVTGSGRSTEPISIREGQIEYDINQKVVRRILRLCAHVVFLSQIQVLLRRAGKGAKFFFTEHGLPEAILTAEQDASIQLYDSRKELGDSFFTGTGTAFSLEDILDDSKVILVVNRASMPEWGLGFFGAIENFSPVEVYRQFHVSLLPLSQLAQFIADPRSVSSDWMQPAVGSLLLLLLLAIPVSNYIKGAILALQRYGYFVSGQSPFEEYVNDNLAWYSTYLQSIIPNISLPSDAQHLLNILDQSKGCTYPLRPGPPIRRVQSGFCIDAFAATAQLNNLIYFPKRDGELGNLRGQHFEDAVQKIIDASPWCPPQFIRGFRRIPLRHVSQGKRALTDIDAIGVKEDKLLIVSCKSIPYTEDYDAGEFEAIRSAFRTIEDAIRWWKKIRNFLEGNMKGANYDFSGYRQIIAVVCTPHVFYVPIGEATQFVVPGLRAAVSYRELMTWLSTSE